MYLSRTIRRLFTTTTVQDELPLDIGSKILGHRHLNSTQPYTAVFQVELIGTYRAFVACRRSVRPVEEYREPTPQRVGRVRGTITQRQVELGPVPAPTDRAATRACLHPLARPPRRPRSSPVGL